MIGLAWLVMSYSEALRRSGADEMCPFATGECSMCSSVARGAVRLSFKESYVNKLKWK